ncbi:hypothetical protein HYY69_07545 [Candidatus Woesearchaeota archaeon]|nr:hypothetical protein [Candidatus Woesearchaeota archaeon]
MSLEGILRGPLRGLFGWKNMDTQQGVYDYLANQSDVKKYLEQNPQYSNILAQKIAEAQDKYGSYRQKRSGGKFLEKVFDYLGLAGDAYFFYNPIGGLGVKLISVLGKAISDLPGLLGYSARTGDYMGIPKLAAAKAASYVPTANLLVDSSLEGIIQRRTVDYAKHQFLREVTGKASMLDKMADAYHRGYDRVKVGADKYVFKPVREAFERRYNPQEAYQGT